MSEPNPNPYPMQVLCQKDDCLGQIQSPDWRCECGLSSIPLTEEATQHLLAEFNDELRTDLLVAVQMGLPRISRERIVAGESPLFTADEVVSIMAFLITGDPANRAIDEKGKAVGVDDTPKIVIAR